MSQHQDLYEVELATEGLDGKGRNGYVLAKEGEKIGLYMAEFGLETNYNCHSDLIDEYVNGITYNRGTVSFNSENIEFNSNLGSKELDEFLRNEDKLKLEKNILQVVNEAAGLEKDLENIKWY